MNLLKYLAKPLTGNGQRMIDSSAFGKTRYGIQFLAVVCAIVAGAVITFEVSQLKAAHPFSAAGFPGAVAIAGPQDAPPKVTKDGKKKDDEEPEEAPVMPWEVFHPDFEDHDFDGTENRAWEYRPYKVAVWFCLDGSPALNALYPGIAAQVTRRSELLDPSGWDLTTGKTPPKFRSQFLRFLETPERIVGFVESKELIPYDKLMIVCLQTKGARTSMRVREFDVQTQQWGPVANRTIGAKPAIAANVTNAIANSFMPLAKIERVTEVEYTDAKGQTRRRDEVVMQVRAVKSCLRTRLVEAALLPQDLREKLEAEASSSEASMGSEEAAEAESTEQGQDEPSEVAEGEAADEVTEPAEASASEDPEGGRFVYISGPAERAPAFIKSDDRFLPIIRRTDRKGNLVKLEPIEFTFLTIEKEEGAVLRSSIQSSARAPLSQRASKRAQKLALVIRPPENPTTLRLVSRDDEELQMEGFEIYSRRPNQDRDEASEFIGKTDWQGEISIPPSEDGLRLIYVKRGSRALKKIPIIPGLYSSVQTTLPNDETRLYAEGVFKGLENEILGLVIQRRVAESEIELAIKEGIAQKAIDAQQKMKELEKYEDLKLRVSEAAQDLKYQTSDSRELVFINSQLVTLRGILDKEIKVSKAQELMVQVQDLSRKARQEAEN